MSGQRLKTLSARPHFGRDTGGTVALMALMALELLAIAVSVTARA